MSAYSPARARPYDLFKTVVAIVLLIIIIVLLLRFGGAAAPVAPAISAATASGDGRLVASGRGQPGSHLELWAATSRLGVAEVGADGAWNFAAQVPPGEYQLIARTVDSAGKTLNASAPVGFTVAAASVVAVAPPATPAPAFAPTTTPPAVAAAAPATPTPAPTTAPATAAPAPTAATPAPSAAPATVAPAPTVASATPATPAPTAANIVRPQIDRPQPGSNGKLVLTGTAQPGASLEIWANGSKLATVIVGSDGKWVYEGPVSPGDYRLTARTVDAAGKMVNESAPQAVSVAAAFPATPAVSQSAAAPVAEGQAYVVQPGDWLTKLAIQFYGDISLYTRIVEGTNAKAASDSTFTRITNPDGIEVGQKLWIPAK